MKHKPNLPDKTNSDLAYFYGLILGDGSLPIANSIRPNGKYQKRHIINFYCNSNKFLKEVYQPLFVKLYGIKPKIYIHKMSKRMIVYNSRIESKEIYCFLEKNGLSVGKKAKIAKIPKLPKKYYPYLLAGLLDTDSGKKGNGFGLSTASNNLAKFCIILFKKFRFSFHSCPWHHNNHIYHQIYVHKKDFSKLLKFIPIRNTEKINYIKSHALVA